MIINLYETFLDNIPAEHYCLQHRINKVSTFFDQNSYGGIRIYENIRSACLCICPFLNLW